MERGKLSESEMPEIDVERKPIGSLARFEKAYETISERIRVQKLNAIDKVCCSLLEPIGLISFS